MPSGALDAPKPPASSWPGLVRKRQLSIGRAQLRVAQPPSSRRAQDDRLPLAGHFGGGDRELELERAGPARRPLRDHEALLEPFGPVLVPLHQPEAGPAELDPGSAMRDLPDFGCAQGAPPSDTLQCQPRELGPAPRGAVHDPDPGRLEVRPQPLRAVGGLQQSLAALARLVLARRDRVLEAVEKVGVKAPPRDRRAHIARNQQGDGDDHAPEQHPLHGSGYHERDVPEGNFDRSKTAGPAAPGLCSVTRQGVRNE
ncbi:MAG TPA: hypothetical protein VEI82_03420 [Myxococcota bacterium]|nr:hypothetical protein [Myxococcota bacterium]